MTPENARNVLAMLLANGVGDKESIDALMDGFAILGEILPDDAVLAAASVEETYPFIRQALHIKSLSEGIPIASEVLRILNTRQPSDTEELKQAAGAPNNKDPNRNYIGSVPFDDQPAIVGGLCLPIVIFYLRLLAFSKSRLGMVLLLLWLGLIIFASVQVIDDGFSAGWEIVFMLLGMPAAFVLLLGPAIILGYFFLPWLALFYSIFLFGSEMYGFLRHGTWHLHTFLDWWPLTIWLEDPQDWVGLKQVLHHTLAYVPIWIVIFVGALWWGIYMYLHITSNYRETRTEYIELKFRRK